VSSSEETDAELLRRIAASDEGALQMLFERHVGWLTLRLRRRTSDPEAVADVLQDTFVAVWRTAGTWRGDGEPAAWLWGIAIRRLISRARGHQEPRPFSLEVIASASRRARSAEDELLVGLEHGNVGQALRSLSPELEVITRATVIDGLSTHEAAHLLGIPHGTVKSRLRTAKVQLRGQLRPMQGRLT